jgi:DNA-directed RNA polymerase subunit E'/Rpb7
METIALFEEKIPITPRDLSRGSVKIEGLLSDKLSQKLEGRCSLHGYVIPGTMKLLSRSVGYIEKGRNTGDIVYHIQAEGNVIYPPDGTILQGEILRKNKMGMFVNYKDAIHVILPRDLHIGNEEFDSLQIGEVVKVEIKKSRFQVNDEYILSVGVYLGKTIAAPAATVQQPMANAVAESDENNEEEQEEEEEGKE